MSFAQLKRLRFEEELESYAKQVEEFQHFGDLEELPKYLKRAQTLDAKLQAAADKADKFNREEEMFGWETISYPLRKQVCPFESLRACMSLIWTSQSCCIVQDFRKTGTIPPSV